MNMHKILFFISGIKIIMGASAYAAQQAKPFDKAQCVMNLAELPLSQLHEVQKYAQEGVKIRKQQEKISEKLRSAPLKLDQ